MAHRLGLGEGAGVLELADRRMVAGQLGNRAVANLEEPRVAHVPEPHEVAVAPGRPATQAMPFSARSPARGLKDRLVGAARASRRSAADVRRQPGAQRLGRNLGRALAGEVSADAVDDAEESAPIVEEEAVLVVVALETRVRISGGAQACRRHERRSSRVNHTEERDEERQRDDELHGEPVDHDRISPQMDADSRRGW